MNFQNFNVEVRKYWQTKNVMHTCGTCFSLQSAERVGKIYHVYGTKFSFYTLKWFLCFILKWKVTVLWFVWKNITYWFSRKMFLHLKNILKKIFLQLLWTQLKRWQIKYVFSIFYKLFLVFYLFYYSFFWPFNADWKKKTCL